MFVKRVLAIVAVAMMATSSFAQAEQRELNGMTNNKELRNAGPTNYLWPGPSSVKQASNIVDLGLRWKNALEKGWSTAPTSFDPKYVVAQYACDPKNVAYKTFKSDSGLATGAQLLPTVSPVLSDTCAKIATYFKDVFLPTGPVVIFNGEELKFRVLAKDVVSASGNWYYNQTIGTPATPNPQKARVTVVWKKYRNAYIEGKKYRNHWLIVDMHSSKQPAP